MYIQVHIRARSCTETWPQPEGMRKVCIVYLVLCTYWLLTLRDRSCTVHPRSKVRNEVVTVWFTKYVYVYIYIYIIIYHPTIQKYVCCIRRSSGSGGPVRGFLSPSWYRSWQSFRDPLQASSTGVQTRTARSWPSTCRCHPPIPSVRTMHGKRVGCTLWFLSRVCVFCKKRDTER
jgi:hypothetical protein